MREEMRSFGYLCPSCKKTVLAARSVFALEAAGAEVECGCGGSALRAVFDGERYQIQVPCGLCGETHTARCTSAQVLESASALACSRTKQFCCFIGPEGTVEKNLRELAVLAEKEQRGDSVAFLDSVIMYEILSELRDIAARPGGLSCGCGSPNVRIEVRRSAVDLICADCGAKLRVPAATDRDLDDLCCRIKLVLPGRP